MDKGKTLSAERRRKTIMSVVLAVICFIYVLPVLTVVGGKVAFRKEEV